jgi:long-chain acyl-CoA synthetase
LNSAQETIHGAVFATARLHPSRTAIMVRRGGPYVGISYAEFARTIERAAARLHALGLRRGDVVGILSPNRPEWIVADLAALSLGAVVVPVYHTIPPDPLQYIINDSGMRMLFVGEASLLSKVQALRQEVGALDTVIPLDEFSVRQEEAGADDSVLSYLPLAHMFERTCGHYVFLFAGGTIAYAQGLATVVDDVAQARPTVLIAVPRVLERAYEAALAKIEKGPWVGRGVVHRAFTLLNECANRRYRGERVPVWLRLRCRMYDALIASRFRRVGGGRLRLIVSGGAPLDRRIGKILRVLGFAVVEGYGLTETSPVVCCGTVEDHRLGTVGKPLDGVEVRIAADGEILVRGPNVMKGYLDKPEETAQVLDAEGWFRTGDLGEFDSDGNLVVTGRSKEIIVTSYGKNVAPAPIEQRLSRSQYVSQAVVFGDNMKSIVALIVPDRAAVMKYAAEHGVASADYDALLAHPTIRELIGQEIGKANAEAASYERVVAFELLAEPFSEASGTLTPTLKIRRKRVAETCTDAIQALYDKLEGKRAH